MTAFVTIAIPFAADRLDLLQAALDRLSNPASDAMRAPLDADGSIHFMTLNAFVEEGGGHLLLEATGDHSEAETVARIAKALTDPLIEALAAAGVFVDATGLSSLLDRRRLKFGLGWFATPGLMFCGTPGLDVGRIRDEARLAEWVEAIIHAGTASTALATLDGVRAALRLEGSDWALRARPAAALDAAPTTSAAGLVLAALWGLAANFFWPFFAVAAAIGLWRAYVRAPESGCVSAVLWGLALACGLSILFALAFCLLAYFKLRRSEAMEIPADSAPPGGLIADIMARENHTAQNHLFAVSTMKVGWFRRVTLRLALFGVGVAAQKVFQPGFLAALGTIHAARFFMLPGTNKLLFLSNYGGSWQSYLDDFISQAHLGLTAVWSNAADFPRANNLAFGGATDGDRFKRWARRQQLPTLFWYGAYPELTTARVRTNAAIRIGLASTPTEREAHDWLALFGSAPAQSAQIATASVQTLALGGMPRVPHACYLFGQLPDGCAAARAWLADLKSGLTFGGARMPDLAVNVAVTNLGLMRLGLSPAELATFPASFQDGMTAPWRSRALGDVERNSPESWRWGGARNPVDFALLVYAQDARGLADALDAQIRRLLSFGGVVVRQVDTPVLPPPEQSSPEPFGFEDGLSQPRIRGLRPTTSADVDHVAEPGELLLGYPDNSGFLPPSPTVAAIDDPDNLLPLTGGHPNAPHDFGRDGTFLVMRQLQQNVRGFWAVVERNADAVRAGARSRRRTRRLGRGQDGRALAQWRSAGHAPQSAPIRRGNRRKRLPLWTPRSRGPTLPVRRTHPPRQPTRWIRRGPGHAARGRQPPSHFARRTALPAGPPR